MNDFNNLCSSIIDLVAPVKIKTKSLANQVPWINEDIHILKRKCRKAEWIWKSTRLHVNFEHWKGILLLFNRIVKAARSAYFSNLIVTNRHNSRFLFNVINELINPRPSITLSPIDCRSFMLFFVDEVVNIRASISPRVVQCEKNSLCRKVLLDSFSAVSEQDIFEIVQQLKPSSCLNDVVPVRLFKEVIGTIGPILLS